MEHCLWSSLEEEVEGHSLLQRVRLLGPAIKQNGECREDEGSSALLPFLSRLRRLHHQRENSFAVLQCWASESFELGNHRAANQSL